MTESPALRFARYLKEFVELRTTTVRDCTKYETVLWFGNMPQESDCVSGAWVDGYEQGDPWLEVRKQRLVPAPTLPEAIRPWVDDKAFRQASEVIPPLRATIFALDDEADLEEGESPPLVERTIEDCPEVTEAYESYRPSWEAWASEYIRRDKIQQVYAELFRLHTQVRKQGEIVEVVLGLGLLDWRAGGGVRIRRHCVVGRTELQFDPARGVIRVMPPGDGAHLRVEDDMLEAEHRPDRSIYGTVDDLLDEIGDDVWDKASVHNALKVWAGALSADSRWSEQLGVASGSEKEAVMSFAPALILRKRTQTGMVRIYDELIGQLSDESTEVPTGWEGLVDDLEDHAPGPTGPRAGIQDGDSLGDPQEVYFPLPANREQRQIVEAIARQRGVLVQGPPGTGKSHTIANLICHLLATGQRVLITAETSRALHVLKDKLPIEVQPLCVSLLGQGGDSFAELNAAVQGITTRQASYSPGAYAGRIAEIDGELDGARRQLAQIDDEIRSHREEETTPHSIGHGEYHGTASGIADRVALESEQFSWLKLPRDAGMKPALTGEELLSWLEIGRRYTDADFTEARLQIPASTDLLPPSEFGRAVAAEKEASEALRGTADLLAHAAYGPISQLMPAVRWDLHAEIKSNEEVRLALDREKAGWIGGALEDWVAGRSGRWNAVLELSTAELPRIESLLDKVRDRVVALPPGLDPRKVRSDVAAALSHFHEGGKWKHLGFLTPKRLRGRTYLRDDVLVDGSGAADIEGLQAVFDDLELEFAIASLSSAWSALGIELAHGDRRLGIAVLREQVEVLAKCHTYAEACHRMARDMASAIVPVPEPDWLAGEAQTWLELVTAAAAQDRLREAARAVDSCSIVLRACFDLHDAHPVVASLSRAIQSRDVTEYSRGHAQVLSIERTRAAEDERRRVESVLNGAVPGLVEGVSSSPSDPDWDTRFAAWPQAWHWAVADSWLEKRSDAAYQQELRGRRFSVVGNISALLGETVTLRAWTHFFDRLLPRESAALKSWREAVRAMGKGTGKSAKMARLRREARKYMDACRDAIPVWIMPRYLVAEMVTPAPKLYDIVIVDEASQLGIESLFLFYIAKKMVVVGDDQQISPYGVGIPDAAIASLQKHFLEGIPHHHALSAQSSLYGNAKIRFSKNIVLREHFRCMPEIIQFSNDLSYASNGTPLDPLRSYPANRLQPTVLRHVPQGYRIGGTQHAQNPAEADAIVAQIAGCIDDPRYAGATMGVISLQGEAQAKLIERKLLATIAPEEVEQRRIICGDAYAFQGDERTVIFLSMVAAPGETRIGVLTNEAARQRFNVAVSRAQDQLWLFHTAKLDVLSEACMRHRLLSYMQDPGRREAIEDQQHFDSEFERAVFRRITDRGFHVRTQVCVGDPTNHRYRIDLVVEGMQGRLAVECDGDRWHGPERYEQDMARQRDLERAGWEFARVRGGDFYRDPAKAMEVVWAELARLGIHPGGVDETAAEPPSPSEQPDRADESDVAVKEKELPSISNEPKSGAEPVGDELLLLVSPFLGQSESEPHSSVEDGARLVESGSPESEEEEASIPNGSNGAGVYVAFVGVAGPDPRTATLSEVSAGLRNIIEVEGPVLGKRAYDVYLRGCGVRRMGGGLKRTMNRALQMAIATGQVVSEDEYDKGGLVFCTVRSKETPPVVLRSRGPRDFAEIPPSEVQYVARRLAMDEGFDLGSEVHVRAVLSFYQLKRLTGQVENAMIDTLTRRYLYVDELLERRSG